MLQNDESGLLNRRTDWLIFGSVFIAGLILRLLLLGSKSLWVDEALTSGIIDRSIPQVIRMSLSGSPHPPLGFILIKLSSLLFGQGEAGLRAFPALASALAVLPLMAFISRKINLKSAFWAGLIWAVSPFAVSLGQEAWLNGFTALIGFVFIDISDRAWHGGRSAKYLLLPVALAGMLVQHLFVFFVIAGFALYFTVPADRRPSLKVFLILAGLFILLYAPFSIMLIKQMSYRADRLSKAGLDMIVLMKFQLVVRIPTVFARLIPGGLLLEAGRQLLIDKKQIVFWFVFCAGQFLLLINLFFYKVFEKKLRIWLLLVFLLPFLIFFREDPTVRHLTILWIPLAVAIAAASDRWKYAGPAITLVSVVMLLPYFNIESFPYHRSNWRMAVEFVEDRIHADEGILVMGGPFGGLAWDYYCTDGLSRTALGGEDPYTERTTPGIEASVVIDSLLEEYESIWIVHDYWGGPSTVEHAHDYTVLLEKWISPTITVVHVSSELM